jgi:hypothetical protein
MVPRRAVAVTLVRIMLSFGEGTFAAQTNEAPATWTGTAVKITGLRTTGGGRRYV